MMTDREIRQYISSGANFYVSLFGEAVHMQKVDKEFYSYVRPKEGEHGISFIYRVHIEDLPAEQKKMVIDEMKAMQMPIWFDLLISDETAFLFSGKEGTHDQTGYDEDGETYLALLLEEKREYQEGMDQIIQVRTAEEFAVWARIANDVLAGGKPDMHPVHHYHLCEEGLMKCYILYHDDIPVSVAATMDDHGAVSLEFVATIPEMRRRGFAKAVCERAVTDAFLDGAFIVTVRAVDAAARRIYQSMGFKVYR